MWYCYTNNCHHKWKNSIIGLVQGVLDRQGESSDISSALNWIVKTLDIDLAKVDKVVNKSEAEKFITSSVKQKIIRKRITKTAKVKIPIGQVKDNHVPSKHFLDLGFTKEIINKYLVQDCHDVTKPMNNRSVFPVFDIENKYMIGVSGRTLQKQCPFCGKHHIGGIKKCGGKFIPKWKHWGFSSSEVLYNWQFAQDHIRETNSLFLLEGPKDVIKFSQNNVYNTTCIFGLNISDFHIKNFVKSGVQNVILSIDNDDAGNDAKEKISKRIGMYFNVRDISKVLEYGEDFADLNDNEFKTLMQHKAKGYCYV